MTYSLRDLCRPVQSTYTAALMNTESDAKRTGSFPDVLAVNPFDEVFAEEQDIVQPSWVGKVPMGNPYLARPQIAAVLAPQQQGGQLPEAQSVVAEESSVDSGTRQLPPMHANKAAETT